MYVKTSNSLFLPTKVFFTLPSSILQPNGKKLVLGVADHRTDLPCDRLCFLARRIPEFSGCPSSEGTHYHILLPKRRRVRREMLDFLQ